MRSRLRTVLAAAAVLGAAGALAVWAWLPFDPFEGPAGRLDEILPGDVDAAFRADGPDLLGAPFVRTLRAHPEIDRLLREVGFPDRVEAPIARVESGAAGVSARSRARVSWPSTSAGTG